MKIGVMTGLQELDRQLQEKIKQVTIAYYPKYFFENTDITIAVVSPIQKLKISFEDFLYELRKKNIRVIVLLDKTISPYLSSCLSLGITDIVFDPITIDKIISKLQYPTPFSDVAKYYIKNKCYSKHNKQITSKITDISINQLKLQLLSLFKYLNKPIKEDLSINELMALLENEIIQRNIH